MLMLREGGFNHWLRPANIKILQPLASLEEYNSTDRKQNSNTNFAKSYQLFDSDISSCPGYVRN